MAHEFYVKNGLLLPNGVAINEFSNEVTLGGDAGDVVPTEHAVKTYVDNVVAANFWWTRDSSGFVYPYVSGDIARLYDDADTNYLEFYHDGTDAYISWNSGTLIFNEAYSFPATTGEAGQILKLQSGAATLDWEDATTALADLTDVNFGSGEPSDGQVLAYDDGEEKWVSVASGTGIFGGYSSSLVWNTTYEAETDGIVIAFGMAHGSTNALAGYTGAVTANVLRASVNSGSTYLSLNICFPVKKGEFWKVAPTPNTPVDPQGIYWMPIGG